MPKDSLAIQAEQRILILRDQKVMLDFHLAELYGVETRALKQAVRRNPERFPADFIFELTADEARLLVSQTVIPGLGKLGGAVPMAFTEQGVAMLSSVLRGERAVQVNIASSATSRPNLRSARIVDGRSWIVDGGSWMADGRSWMADRGSWMFGRPLLSLPIKNPQSTITNHQSPIPLHPVARHRRGRTRMERERIGHFFLSQSSIHPSSSSPNYPISNLQCLFLSPIRREFQLPANRAFIG